MLIEGQELQGNIHPLAHPGGAGGVGFEMKTGNSGCSRNPFKELLGALHTAQLFLNKIMESGFLFHHPSR